LGTGKTQKSATSPTSKNPKGKIKPALRLLISCMKFLFPQRIVTIFNLDCYSHYKLGVLIVHANLLCFAKLDELPPKSPPPFIFWQ
jgi:hypothetical protein